MRARNVARVKEAEERTVVCPRCHKPFRVAGPPTNLRCHRCMSILIWHPANKKPAVEQRDDFRGHYGGCGRKTVREREAASQAIAKRGGKKKDKRQSPSRRKRKAVWQAEQSKRLQYMASPEWQDVRMRKFEQVGRVCEKCGAASQIQVHHLTYANLYHENLDDLQVLCEACHRAVHGLTEKQGVA